MRSAASTLLGASRFSSGAMPTMSLVPSLVVAMCLAALPAPAEALQNADAPPEQAAEEVDAKAPSTPAGRVVRLTSPIDDTSAAAVRLAVSQLRGELDRGREAVLVLELPPGTSQFHHILNLSTFLASAEVSDIRTVCWMPETVDGYNAIIPLVCREVVMHPDAEIGDIGRGEALPEEQLGFLRRVVNKGRNSRVPVALAVAMADPRSTLLAVDVELDGGRIEKRVLLRTELEALRDTGVRIPDSRVLKEPGQTYLLPGEQAEALGVLVRNVATGLDEVVEQYGLPPEVMRRERIGGDELVVRRIEVRDVIDPLLYSFVSNQIREAVSDGANLIIFEIDSPGGQLAASEDLANQIADLENRGIRTVAWVPNEAISGAAIISLACDEIVLRPEAIIGDAGPILMREGGQFEHADAKVVSVLRAYLENLAERKGHPPAIAMAMVDRGLNVFEVTNAKTGRVWYMTDEQIHNSGGKWIKGRKLPETRDNDLFLTVDGERAAELRLAEPPVQDFDELRLRLGVPPEMTIPVVDRTWMDDLVFLLNTPFITTALFFIGILCIYLELHLMSGILSIVAVTCFALFFWSRSFGGTAGTLGAVLFVLGLIFLALEIFVIPGFGVFGVTGILLTLGSLVVASMTFRGFSTDATLASTGQALGQLAIAIAGVIVFGATLGKLLPRIPLFNSMLLAPPGAGLTASDGVRLSPHLEAPNAELVGRMGQATTVLRPAGKAQIDGRYLDVVSDGPFVPVGAAVEVIRVEGNRVVVRPESVG